MSKFAFFAVQGNSSFLVVFFRVHAKKCPIRNSLNRKNPPNYTVLNGGFGHFPETPVFRGHSCGYAAARTSRECATPLTGKPKHWKMFCRNPSTSVAYSDTPAPQVAAQLRPLVYYFDYRVTTNKITRYNEKLYPQVHST